MTEGNVVSFYGRKIFVMFIKEKRFFFARFLSTVDLWFDVCVSDLNIFKKKVRRSVDIFRLMRQNFRSER